MFIQKKKNLCKKVLVQKLTEHINLFLFEIVKKANIKKFSEITVEITARFFKHKNSFSKFIFFIKFSNLMYL